MLSLSKSLGLLVALLSAVAFAVHPVDVRGQDFVDTVSNKRVMIIGVDYQPGGQGGYKPQEGQDALTNGTICLRDAALLQRLGVNTIRVYNVSPMLNHDDCASIFNAVGIYMMIDVNSPLPGESINRDAPWTSYNSDYLTRVFGIVENFKGYPNTMAFFSANEVMNDVASSKNNPLYIRAVQRDVRNYIAKHSDRHIPIGYSAADVREILEDTWAYLQCAIDGKDDDMSRSEFFGLNSYSWCGDASFQSSGYNNIVTMFSKSTIPVFFSEYGCNEVLPRIFTEVGALYGPQMTSLSGGLVYEYSMGESGFGLVTINEDTTVKLIVDYENLQKEFNKLDIGLIQSTNASAMDLTIPKCSDDLISNSGFDKNFTIPAPPPGTDGLIKNGIKNPQNGKLVKVTETNVPMAAYGSNGVQIEGLAIKPLPNDESNTPGGNTSPSASLSPSTTTGAAASPSPTKGSANTVRVNGACALLAVALLCLL